MEAPRHSTTERRLVTIVAEAVVESRLIRDVKACGARGYSLGHVRGEGETGHHVLELNGPSIRLETVVTDSVAERIFEMLAADYFEKFAVVAWVSTVHVMRPQRF
jgi:nitrogen regulatory protein P-II 2